MTDRAGRAAAASRTTSRPPRRAADRARWAEADRAARPARLGRLRERLAEAGVDAYFGVRPEHMRYLTGFALGEGEEKVAGLVGPVPRRGRRGRPVRRLPLHDPGRARGARTRGSSRSTATCDALAGAGRVASGRAGSPSRRRSSATRPGRGSRPRRRTSSWSPSRAGSRRPGDQGAGRARADRGGLRRRRPGARGAPAGDPARRRPSASSPCGSSG